VDVWQRANGVIPASLRATYNIAGSMTMFSAITNTTDCTEFVPAGYAISNAYEMVIGSEHILVTAVSGTPNGHSGFNPTACVRGYAGTMAATHLVNAAWFAVDVIHLNQAGYTVWANLIAAWIQTNQNYLVGNGQLGPLISGYLTRMLAGPITVGSTAASLGPQIIDNGGLNIQGGVIQGAGPGLNGLSMAYDPGTGGHIQSYGSKPLTLDEFGTGLNLGKSTSTTAIKGSATTGGNMAILGGALAGQGLSLSYNVSTGSHIQSYGGTLLNLDELGTGIQMSKAGSTTTILGYLSIGDVLGAGMNVEYGSAYGATVAGTIQTYGAKPLFLNPLGSNVLLGSTTDGGQKLQVTGSIAASVGYQANGSTGATKTCSVLPTVVGGIVTAC
jgi:hypothetical protein